MGHPAPDQHQLVTRRLLVVGCPVALVSCDLKSGNSRQSIEIRLIRDIRASSGANMGDII